ncbi:MAG: hypothetical protein QM539_10725 [Alphaproteobacteria bacterium]|nr:hypothetical protein [Alphaproteobacteria bacterium]
MKKIVMLNLMFAMVALTCIYCTKAVPDTSSTDCTSVTVTYTQNIAPIINSSCAIPNCHNSISRKSGLDYSTYSLTKAGAANNNFLGSIQQLSGYEAMPQNAPKLSDSSIKLIICWIKSGYPQ